MDNGESNFFKDDERDQSFEEERQRLGLPKPDEVNPFIEEILPLTEEKRKELEQRIIYPAPKEIM